MTSALTSDQQLDPARAYRAFEAFFAPFERRITEHATPLAGYARKAVGQRVAQRVVEIAVYPFIGAAATSHARGMSSGSRTAVELGGLRFRNDHVTVTPAKWVRSVAEFCVQWTRVLGYLAGPSGKAIPKRATLLSGVGLADLAVDGSDARFLEFCMRGPLPPLRNADHLIVESAQSLASSQPTRRLDGGSGFSGRIRQ